MCFSCNEVWLFDFEELVWKKPVITGKKPNPRYGQSQVWGGFLCAIHDRDISNRQPLW